MKTASCLVDADATGARMLVTPNPYFFDATLSKGAIQVIMIRRFAGYEEQLKGAEVEIENARMRGRELRTVDIAKQRQVELIRAIDWNKVADMFLGKP